MQNSISVLWTPAGINALAADTYKLVDLSDGDTPNMRMPIRMLSIDTPEVYQGEPGHKANGDPKGALRVDALISDLADWIKTGDAPVSAQWADYILPMIESGEVSTHQYNQGKAASAAFEDLKNRRLRRESGSIRKLFVRFPKQSPLDSHGRLLAMVAPSYSEAERKRMTRLERSTFNLDMVRSGWAAPFIIYPNIPGELDLPLFVEAAQDAIDHKRGQHADPLSLDGYEYRMLDKLTKLHAKVKQGKALSSRERYGWRSRYCASIRTLKLVGPEDYFTIPKADRIWFWPEDVQEAIGKLNLRPAF